MDHKSIQMNANNMEDNYPIQYQCVRRQIVEAATQPWAVMDCLGIELMSGVMTVFDEVPDLLKPGAGGHEALRQLAESNHLGQLKKEFHLRRVDLHDIVLAYAVIENEIANFLLGEHASRHGWSVEEALYLGRLTGRSTRDLLQWGVTLRRASKARSIGRGYPDNYPEHWIFRPAASVPVCSWRRPRTVWVTPEHWSNNRPQMRQLEGHQLAALTRALDYSRRMHRTMSENATVH